MLALTRVARYNPTIECYNIATTQLLCAAADLIVRAIFVAPRHDKSLDHILIAVVRSHHERRPALLRFAARTNKSNRYRGITSNTHANVERCGRLLAATTRFPA